MILNHNTVSSTAALQRNFTLFVKNTRFTSFFIYSVKNQCFPSFSHFSSETDVFRKSLRFPSNIDEVYGSNSVLSHQL